MLDLAVIRKDPDRVRAAVKNKHEKADVDAILRIDEEKRALQTKVDALRKEVNDGSKQIGQIARQGGDIVALKARMKALGDEEKAGSARMKEMEDELERLLLWVPNLPASDVPIGEDAAANTDVAHWGERRTFGFTPKPHWDLAKDLGIIDFERGARMAGSGFILYLGLGARLQRALINFMIDLHTREHGYTEVWIPILANRDAMRGTGQIPKLEDDMYRLKEEDLFLIPTAEVPVTNIYRTEILKAEDLPRKLTAYSACFRREAGAAGRDTRGLVRIHQFDKVELVKLAHPETSYVELESLLGNARRVLELLGLEHRVITLCTGDMSFASAKTYDIEAWAPGLDRWLEVSSCSNFEDFQARRMNLRFRDKDGKVRFVHTLNGSGLALPRTVICLLETWQRSDGTVEVPPPLRPYLGVDVIGPVKSA